MDQNCKTQNYENSRRNLKENVCGFELGKMFLDTTPNAQITKKNEVG